MTENYNIKNDSPINTHQNEEHIIIESGSSNATATVIDCNDIIQC